MRIERFEWDGQDPRGLAAEIRALQPALGEVSEPVAEIIAAMRSAPGRPKTNGRRARSWAAGSWIPPPSASLTRT